MKTVAINKRSKTINQLLEIANEEDVVVQTPEGDLFLVMAIDDFGYEVARQRADKKLMAFLDKRFREARHDKGIPLEEVARRLGLKSATKKSNPKKSRTAS